MRTPSCPLPDSNQEPCQDAGREHRPGEEVESDHAEHDDDEDEEDEIDGEDDDNEDD